MHSGRQAGRLTCPSSPRSLPSGCQTFTGLAEDLAGQMFSCRCHASAPGHVLTFVTVMLRGCAQMSSVCCSCKCNRCCCRGINHLKRSEGTCCLPQAACGTHMFARCRRRLSSVWFMLASNMNCELLTVVFAAVAASTAAVCCCRLLLLLLRPT